MTGLAGEFLRIATDTAASNDRRMAAAIASGATLTTLYCGNCAAYRVHVLSDVVLAPNVWRRATCQCGEVQDWRKDTK